MGISTYQSYCGAQIFDAVGLSSAFVDKYFTGTASMIEGAGLLEVAEETVRRHAAAYGDNPIYEKMLDVGGIYQFRLRGEEHAWTPATVANLQHAVRSNSQERYRAFAVPAAEAAGIGGTNGKGALRLVPVTDRQRLHPLIRGLSIPEGKRLRRKAIGGCRVDQ